MGAINNEPLTDKEKKELEVLDDPTKHQKFDFFSILWYSFLLFFNFFGVGSFFGSNWPNSPTERKERVVKLRTKMKMYELDINPNVDYQKYYEVRKEEEKRFDERFKNVN